MVDSISSFLCDPFDMEQLGVAAMITGSQKALACPPGVSVIVLSEDAVQRVYKSRPTTLYLDLKLALKDGERGQTPFTPAVGILRQINVRLKQIESAGGADTEVTRAENLATYFRSRIQGLPFQIVSSSLSNAVTPLSTREGVSAFRVFELLKDKYDIWICPNGGDLRDKMFRVGHIGALTECDYDRLISAFHDMRDRGLL